MTKQMVVNIPLLFPSWIMFMSGAVVGLFAGMATGLKIGFCELWRRNIRRLENRITQLQNQMTKMKSVLEDTLYEQAKAARCRYGSDYSVKSTHWYQRAMSAIEERH